MSIAKINLDFQVLQTDDPRVLLIADSSEWSNIVEKPSIIEITLPATEVPITHYFDKSKINIFNSVNLKYSNDLVDLPDGIYQIKLKGSPDTYNVSRSYLRTELTQLDLDTIYMNFDLFGLGLDRGLYKTLSTINLYLRAAEAHARHGSYSEAQELLFKAQGDIEKLKECRNCG